MNKVRHDVKSYLDVLFFEGKTKYEHLTEEDKEQLVAYLLYEEDSKEKWAVLMQESEDDDVNYFSAFLMNEILEDRKSNREEFLNCLIKNIKTYYDETIRKLMLEKEEEESIKLGEWLEDYYDEDEENMEDAA